MLIYTDLLERIVADMTRRVPELAHIDPERVAIAAAARWAGSRWGNLATCIGLRDEAEPIFSIWTNGRSRSAIEVGPWRRSVAARVRRDGRACRYLILLRLPRLLENGPLETLVHELFHVGEGFDGRMRPMRHGRLFDWSVRRLTRKWLDAADPELADAARCNLSELRRREGAVVARRLPDGFRPSIPLACRAPCSYEEGIARHYPGFRLAEGYRVREEPTTAAEAPPPIEVRDAALRLYHDRGSEDLSPAAARHLRRRAISGAPLS